MLCIWKAISEVKTTKEKMDVDEKYTLSKIERQRWEEEEEEEKPWLKTRNKGKTTNESTSISNFCY